MRDAFGRTIDYLRVSLTDRCNLRCGYCMPQQGVPSLSHGEVLSLEELLRLCGIFASLGVTKFKITGGEPLVRMGATQFIAALKKMPGVEQVTLTTNGVELARHLPDLAKAGLDGLNISLDTLRADTFARLTGRDALDAVVQSVTEACRMGLAVKLNCLPMRGINDRDLVDLAGFARNQVRAVRFIELMPVGLASHYTGMPTSEVLQMLEAAFGPLSPCSERLGNGPARYWTAKGFAGRIGAIQAISEHFCATCNRVRLTSEGRLKMCLSHDVGIALKEPLRGGMDDSGLAELITTALWDKPRMHFFADAQQMGPIPMHRIGG